MRRPQRSVGAKPKNFKKSLKQLVVYLKPFYIPIIIAISFAIITTIVSVINPSIVKNIINLLSDNLESGNIPVERILKLGIILLVVYILSALLDYAVGFIMTTVTNKISKNLRRDISRKINYLPLSYLDKTTHGDMLSRITNDVDLIAQTFNNSILNLVTSTLQLTGAVIMMFVSSYILAFCAIGSSFIGFVLVIIIMRTSQKHFIAQQRSLGELNGHIEEIYGGHIIVKAYNAENQAIDKFTKINKSLYNSAWKAQFISGTMMPIMNFVGNLGYVVVCVVGGVLTVNGTIDFGTIAQFMLYISLFSNPLNRLAQVATQLQSTLAASERVFEVLDAPELVSEKDKTLKIENCKGNVEFKHVKFGYDKDRVIIHDFSAKVKAGQKVAIVGPTGAGKTTLVNLLMRFYEVDDGEILIDGVSTKDITRENLHDLFSMVLQDTWIYNASVKDNVVYSKENVSDEEIKNACKAVGLHHFIKTLPKGYDTILDENTSISAGQKQLLTIARAMIQNSPMLILDEATSSVDTRLEMAIQKAMDKLTKNRTSFVIAHRLSTIKNADLILVMKDGDVIESGTHQELLNKGGFYSELYNSQFED